MTYTYDDIVTAKDILAGRVKKEDIIGKKGWFMDSMPCDMSLDGIEGESKHYCLGHVELNWECPFFADDGDGGTWTYFLPEKETYFLPEKEGSASITRFKIGDRVKYHGKFAERFANDFATVRSVDSGDRNLTYYIELKGNHYLWVNESDISPVCNEQSIATANPLFKVGDRVKIVKERNEFTEVYNPTIGKTGRIEEIDKYGHIRVVLDLDNDWRWYNPDAVELIEDEPTYIPFDLSSEEDRDALRDKWVKSTNPDVFHEFKISQFVRMNDDHQTIYVKTGTNRYSGNDLFYDYVFADGSPVGRRKEE